MQGFPRASQDSTGRLPSLHPFTVSEAPEPLLLHRQDAPQHISCFRSHPGVCFCHGVQAHTAGHTAGQ